MKVKVYNHQNESDYLGIKNLMVELCTLTGSDFDENRFKSTIQKRAQDKYNRKGILIAEDEGKIVGMLLAEILVSPYVETYGNLSNFVVSESSRGKGVGKALMEKAFEFFRDMGISRVETNVRDLDKEGKLFLNYGFNQKYIVMEKKISMEEFSKPY